MPRFMPFLVLVIVAIYRQLAFAQELSAYKRQGERLERFLDLCRQHPPKIKQPRLRPR